MRGTWKRDRLRWATLRVPFARTCGHIVVVFGNGDAGRTGRGVAIVGRAVCSLEPGTSIARGTERYRRHQWGGPDLALGAGNRESCRKAAADGCGHAHRADGRRARTLPGTVAPIRYGPASVRPADREVPGGSAQLGGVRGRGSRGHHICRRRGIRDFPPRNRRRADVPRGRHREDPGRPRRRALGAGIAHQVHGAIGFTSEDSLQHRTRRLWAWRGEFGPEAVWAIDLGRYIAKE